MNREIKFRAWDGEEMVYQLDFNHTEPTKILSCFLDIFRKDAIIMQYTGLKDKNGQEIYEGDVLFEERGNQEYYYKIWCRRGGFVFNAHQDDLKRPIHQILFWEGLSDMQNSAFISQLEIIGNIHENSELFTQTTVK